MVKLLSTSLRSNFHASTNVKQPDIAVELSITGNIHIFQIIIVQFGKETGIQTDYVGQVTGGKSGVFAGNVRLLAPFSSGGCFVEYQFLILYMLKLQYETFVLGYANQSNNLQRSEIR